MRANHDYLTEECTQHQLKNEALLRENEQLTGQLATRTVMYNAQMRKFHEEQRYHSSQFSDKEKENIALAAKLEQLSEQYEQCCREKTEVELSYREVLQVKSTLEMELAGTEEARHQAEDDLNAATEQNRNLQAIVDSLRGTDFEDIQQNFVREVENIRAGGRATEDDLRRQVAELRRQTSATAEEKERLVEEAQHLSAEVNELNELLNRMGHSHQQSHVLSHQQSLFQYSESRISHNDDSVSLLSQFSAAENIAHKPHVGGAQQIHADNPLRQSTDSTGSFWSIGMMAEGRARNSNKDDAGDSHVLQSSREGLPGIAYREVSAEQTAELLHTLLTVLDSIAQSVSTNLGQRGLTQLAERTVAQLADSRTLDLSDGAMRHELLRAVDTLVKRLVEAVHAHLGGHPNSGGRDADGSAPHTHRTPEALRRAQASLEPGTPALSSVAGSSGSGGSDGEKGDTSDSGSLPLRYQSNGAEEDDETHRLRRKGEYFMFRLGAMLYVSYILTRSFLVLRSLQTRETA